MCAKENKVSIDHSGWLDFGAKTYLLFLLDATNDTTCRRTIIINAGDNGHATREHSRIEHTANDNFKRKLLPLSRLPLVISYESKDSFSMAKSCACDS